MSGTKFLSPQFLLSKGADKRPCYIRMKESIGYWHMDAENGIGEAIHRHDFFSRCDRRPISATSFRLSNTAPAECQSAARP